MTGFIFVSVPFRGLLIPNYAFGYLDIFFWLVSVPFRGLLIPNKYLLILMCLDFLTVSVPFRGLLIPNLKGGNMNERTLSWFPSPSGVSLFLIGQPPRASVLRA